LKRHLLTSIFVGTMLLATGFTPTKSIYAQRKNLTSKSSMNNMEFYGSSTSISGIKVETVITHNDNNKEWPYLSVLIFDVNDNQLYESVKYASWFKIKLGWDKKDRFWIKSSDTGIDVIALSDNIWCRYRWNNSLDIDSMIDIENDIRLEIVDWPLPEFIK
jgi:hypothetical protein